MERYCRAYSCYLCMHAVAFRCRGQSVSAIHNTSYTEVHCSMGNNNSTVHEDP